MRSRYSRAPPRRRQGSPTGTCRPPASSLMSPAIQCQRTRLRSPREIPQSGADRPVHNSFDQHFADAPFTATPDRDRYRAPCRRDRIGDVNERERCRHAGKKLQNVALHSVSPLPKRSPIPSSIIPKRRRTEGQKVPPNPQSPLKTGRGSGRRAPHRHPWSVGATAVRTHANKTGQGL